MGQIHGKPITWSRRLTTEAAAKGRANQEQIYRSSEEVIWGRRLTTEAAAKGGGKGEGKSRANLQES